LVSKNKKQWMKKKSMKKEVVDFMKIGYTRIRFVF
jgi:hypothetical protein